MLRWLIITLVGWFLLLTAASLDILPRSESPFLWTIVQQTWFIFGGVMGLSGQGALKLRLRDLARGAAAGGGIFLLNIFLAAVALVVVSRLFGSEVAQQLFQQERTVVDVLIRHAQEGQLGLIVLMVAVGAPIGEEVVFRGLLVGVLQGRLGSRGAVLLSAFFFAAVHLYVIQFLPVLVSGVVLGLLYTRSGNLLRPITAHMVANSLVLVLSLMASS